MAYKAIEIKVYECTCDKCGHIWQTKKYQLPIFCPNKKCSSPTAWDKDSRLRRVKKDDTDNDLL